MPKISVVICCANVADTLGPACESVAWADELVIVDSGSGDATAEVAKRYANRYVVEPWRGYTEQKKFGTSLCTHEWVLVLDGDEECSPQLAREIQSLTDEQLDQFDVLSMPRRNWVMGRPVRAWYPDWQSRLIHRDRVIWSDEVLHDARLPSDPSRGGKLRGWLEHKRHSRAGFTDYFNGRQEDERLLMVARQMYARGKRCTLIDLVFRPHLTFLKFFVFKRGFLDGQFGLLIAQKAALAVQFKYAALWAIQNGIESPEQVNVRPMETS